MNPEFFIVDREGVSFVVYRPWWDEGIVHGSTLGPISFAPDSMSASAGVLKEAVGATQIANLRQNHGNVFFDARAGQSLELVLKEKRSLERFEECDAIIAPVSQNVPAEVVAYGVSTADCVPVVVRGQDGWAMIHAGWRGLANRIIERTVLALGAPLEVAIFPCAGGESYEVGLEVIDAIGSSAAFTARDGESTRVLLDTAQTAVNQLGPLLRGGRVETSGMCTITDTRLHSHRRDGERAGRALTFVTPKSSK